MASSSSDSIYTLHMWNPSDRDFFLLFVHQKKSFSIKKFWEFFHFQSPNFCNYILTIVKKSSPHYDSYFIIRINLSLQSNALETLLNILHAKIINKVDWIPSHKIRNNRHFISFADHIR